MLSKLSVIQPVMLVMFLAWHPAPASTHGLESTRRAAEVSDLRTRGDIVCLTRSRIKASTKPRPDDSMKSERHLGRPSGAQAGDSTISRWREYSPVIKKFIFKDYKKMYREKGGNFKYPFLTPGSTYSDQLWDWDSYFSDVALRQILLEDGTPADSDQAIKYERGCVLNFLHYCHIDGWVPILIQRNSVPKPKDIYKENMHKPCLAQQAAFLVEMEHGNAEWLRNKFYKLQYFVENYKAHDRDPATGLYFWQTDHYIGVDNDPCTFYRPPRSSGSIFLNCFMYKEFRAMVYLSQRLGFNERAREYERDADDLREAIQKNCWDPRDGSFYSVDLDLLPINNEKWGFQSGAPRDYNCLIQRIDVWSDFLPMWAGIATPQQAKRIVKEHYENTETFNAPYGVRSLSKVEKMYSLRASGNPSNWDGPIWGISNYLVWRGLVKYGYNEDARKLAEKTVVLFGRDLERTGTLHEYYDPDNGLPILHPGFQDWNYLVLNMLAWLEHKPIASEF